MTERQPCWFYNNGGCKNKDGSIKSDHECKYEHVFTNKCVKPAHAFPKKACDKYNLEGSCKWVTNCKYSHELIESKDWEKYYPNIPYIIHVNVKKRLEMEKRVQNLEEQVRILRYKHDCMQKDFDSISKLLHEKMENI